MEKIELSSITWTERFCFFSDRFDDTHAYMWIEGAENPDTENWGEEMIMEEVSFVHCVCDLNGITPVLLDLIGI